LLEVSSLKNLITPDVYGWVESAAIIRTGPGLLAESRRGRIGLKEDGKAAEVGDKRQAMRYGLDWALDGGGTDKILAICGHKPGHGKPVANLYFKYTSGRYC